MATLNKMTGFKVFRGTKQSFIDSGKATTYADAVVFITGGSDASKSCIFAQGTYFANFTEFIAGYVSAMNYVKGVSVGETSYNAAAGGGYIGFDSADPTTVALDVQNGKVTVGLTDAFINKVNATATALGTKDDAAAADGSAFARIANLAALIAGLAGEGTGSVSERITAAINALRTEIVGTLDSGDATTLQAINDELDGLASVLAAVKVNGKAIVSNGVGQEVVLDGTDIKVGGESGLKATTVEATLVNHEGRIKANEDAIAVLNGNASADGSIDKKIQDAINAFAGTANGDTVIDNVTELLSYVSGVDGSKDLASAIAQIADNKGKIETLNGADTVAGSVKKTVKDAIDVEIARANSAYATAAQGAKADSALQSVAPAENSYVTVSGKTAENTQAIGVTVQKVADASESAKGLAEASDVKSYVNGVVGNYYTKAETYSKDEVYTKAEVDAMWMWEEL